jgi:hypothetical protein
MLCFYKFQITTASINAFKISNLVLWMIVWDHGRERKNEANKYKTCKCCKQHAKSAWGDFNIKSIILPSLVVWGDFNASLATFYISNWTQTILLRSQVLPDPLTKLPPHLFIVVYRFSHELLPILILRYMNS